MGFIKDFIQKYFFETPERRRDAEIWKEANDLAKQGRYAEAAEVNMRYSLEKLKENELIYCSYCGYAFEMWLKAKEPDKALREARNVLRVYVDGEWLKKYPEDHADELMSMVSRLFAAGHTAEAAAFAGEVNHQFEAYGLPMRCAAAPVGRNIFPSSCFSCGAKLIHNPYHDTAHCRYCKAITYALNHAPETVDAGGKIEEFEKPQKSFGRKL